MGVSEKVMEALRAGILLNERVTTLIDKVNRMDQDIRHMNDISPLPYARYSRRS